MTFGIKLVFHILDTNSVWRIFSNESWFLAKS